MSDSIFITNQELQNFKDWNSELLNKVTGQFVYFHKISKEKSKIDDFYKEVINIVLEEPKKVHCLINITTQDNSFEQGQLKEQFYIECYLTYESLITIDFTSSRDAIGNYISWGDKFFEITSCVSPQLVFGEPDWKFGAIMKCVLIQKLTPILEQNIKKITEGVY